MNEVIHAYICSLGFKLIDDQELQTWTGEVTEYIYENNIDNVQFTFDDWKSNTKYLVLFLTVEVELSTTGSMMYVNCQTSSKLLGDKFAY